MNNTTAQKTIEEINTLSSIALGILTSHSVKCTLWMPEGKDTVIESLMAMINAKIQDMGGVLELEYGVDLQQDLNELKFLSKATLEDLEYCAD